MTLYGKIFVLLNMALALMLAAWSFNIYANGVDWTDRKTPRLGQYAIRAAKLDELWKSVPPVQQDWLRERAALASEEKRLADERVSYDKEIGYVLVGPAKNKGIFQVAIAPNDDPATGVKRGQILLDAKGFPQLTAILGPMNNPLQLMSLAEYNKEEDSILREIEKLVAVHSANIAEAVALTDKIIGDKAKGIRGLQQRINDEQAKNADLLAEISLVEPQFLNTLVEAQLVNKRNAQMLQRIEELKRTKVASK